MFFCLLKLFLFFLTSFCYGNICRLLKIVFHNYYTYLLQLFRSFWCFLCASFISYTCYECCLSQSLIATCEFLLKCKYTPFHFPLTLQPEEQSKFEKIFQVSQCHSAHTIAPGHRCMCYQPCTYVLCSLRVPSLAAHCCLETRPNQ